VPTTARFIVLWGTPTDRDAFDRHYRDIHIPLVTQLPGLRRYTLSRNIESVRGEEPPHQVAELDWDDMHALRSAFDSEVGRVIADDVDHLAQWAAVRSIVLELEDHL
jgi:uncharacterized protein (TIGR02118 family)